MSRVFVFRCPECSKLERSDQPGEPCCTGPDPSRHEHDLQVMHLQWIEEKRVSNLEFIAPPDYSAMRARSPLIFPDTDERVKAAVKRSLILPG
jgi:hypothetical protein